MKMPDNLAFQGTFEEARAAARAQRRWLLVHLHQNDEFKSWQVIRDIWNDDMVKDVSINQ